MISAKGAVGQRASLVSALALLICSVPAHAATITVDGNLADIIGVVGTTNALNYAYGSDPLGSTEDTESNNGFDIKNVYAFYDQPMDILYLGLSVYGTVGDSQPFGSTAANEGIANLGLGSNNRSVFDANETFGIRLFSGTSINDPLLLAFNVLGANDGTDSLTGVTNPYSLTINRAVSETHNGVEFSIYGLYTNAALLTAPTDLLIRFSAGSSDTNFTSTAPEDTHLLQMQVVPVPAAAWLLGSGLLGLVAVARRKG